MPLRFNIDHSPACVENGPAVLPGETYDFTDEQIAAGIAGRWSENDPRDPAPQTGVRGFSDTSSDAPEQTTDDPTESDDQQTADLAEEE